MPWRRAAWQEIARQKAIEFQVLDVAQREGREIVARLGLRTVRATVIDGKLRFAGISDRGQALAAVASAEDRGPDAVQHAGITQATTSAWAISAAAVYLGLIGAALVWGGGIDGEGPQRNAALAVFAFGEHLLPRFTGGRIRGGSLAWIQQALLHLGVVLLAAGMTFIGGRLRYWAESSPGYRSSYSPRA